MTCQRGLKCRVDSKNLCMGQLLVKKDIQVGHLPLNFAGKLKLLQKIGSILTKKKGGGGGIGFVRTGSS